MEEKKKQKPRKGDQIRFWAMNEWTGANTLMIGKVLGFGDAVRKMWPTQMAHAPNDYLLVQRIVHGVKSLYAVIPEDVDSIISTLFEKEN